MRAPLTGAAPSSSGVQERVQFVVGGQTGGDDTLFQPPYPRRDGQFVVAHGATSSR